MNPQNTAKTKWVVEILGWAGMSALLLAFGLISFGWLETDSVLYKSLNLGGGIGLIINAYAHRAYPIALLNVIWALVALVSFIR